MARLFWLSNEAWAKIEPHLPRGQPAKPRVDDRRVISGILHVLKVGCRWRGARGCSFNERLPIWLGVRSRDVV